MTKSQYPINPIALSISVVLHFVVIASYIYINTVMYETKKPTPYIVTLVSEPAIKIPEPALAAQINTDPAPSALSTKPKEVMPPAKAASPKEKPPTDRLQERIAELEAKKRLENLVRLRNIIDVHKKPTASTGSKPHPTGSATSQAEYLDLVQGKIRQNWVYPETLDRDLEAVISIRIAKDGTATVLGIEKSSGNRLFDRSVLIAISKASPLPKPDKEIEIGVRFKP